MKILDRNSLFWWHHLQDGYERRIELQQNYATVHPHANAKPRTKPGKT